MTTGGEMLLPAVQDLIETAFGVKVIDACACNEARDIAWQCRQAGGYHVNADNLIVENITLPDGRIVLWNQLKGLMNHPQIRRFRLVQERNGDFAVRCVPENGADPEQLDRLLRDRFRTLIGDAIPIPLEWTASVAPGPTGKSKLVVCPDPAGHDPGCKG